MSAYVKVGTEFRDEDTLCQALREEGLAPAVHAKAVALTDYQGQKRPETAEIVVPRRQVGGMSNDIGFQRQEDGTFRAIVSEFDQGKYNEAWFKKLKRVYGEKRAVKLAQQQGLKLVDRKAKVDAQGKHSVKLIFQKAGV